MVVKAGAASQRGSTSSMSSTYHKEHSALFSFCVPINARLVTVSSSSSRSVFRLGASLGHVWRGKECGKP